VVKHWVYLKNNPVKYA